MEEEKIIGIHEGMTTKQMIDFCISELIQEAFDKGYEAGCAPIFQFSGNCWKSVKDSLPCTHEVVLIYVESNSLTNNPFYDIGFYQRQKNRWYAEDLSDVFDGDYHVTYWMPLPQKPHEVYERENNE